jgi:uncharacterized integral membrane protein (TIGR00698 family)
VGDLLTVPGWRGLVEQRWRGVLAAVAIAVCAQFLSEHYGGPTMLFALLIGMAFNFLAKLPATELGVRFSSSILLRWGVALLGLRIAFADIAQLGASTVAAIVGFIAFTILSGVVAARFAGRSWHYGVLTGGAVAICGASAALAIAAILPKTKISEKDVMLTVVGVTTLSTLAMILYPVLFAALGLDHAETGFLIGATIHDVAQVVGAGYSVSEGAGDIATITKLLRVAMLPVVLIGLSLIMQEGKGKAFTLPWFLIGFIGLMLLTNLVALPSGLVEAANTTSRWLLVVAVSALGIRTSLGELQTVGFGKMLVVLAATLVLLLIAIVFILLSKLIS